ncbi:MAG TPA: glycine dehydrogenase subunit 2, partial [Bacillota bacterium]|nr:glycine dehydrogenase subunit 2 [Bacillota bacterium]
MKDVRLRKYHSAAWDEPLVMEMGTKGERGIIPPKAAKEVAEKLGDALDLLPAGMRREKSMNLPEISQ